MCALNNTKERSYVIGFLRAVANFNYAWENHQEVGTLRNKVRYLAVVNDEIIGRTERGKAIDAAIKDGLVVPFDSSATLQVRVEDGHSVVNVGEAIDTLVGFTPQLREDYKGEGAEALKTYSDILDFLPETNKVFFLVAMSHMLTNGCKGVSGNGLSVAAQLIPYEKTRSEFIGAFGTAMQARNIFSRASAAGKVHEVPYTQAAVIDELAFYPARAGNSYERMR